MINILVVDDDVNFNKMVCSYLNTNGYNAKSCTSPSEAYDVMCSSLYDLIISDITMPEIDGFEFVETVRSINQTIPILLMSARDDIRSKEKAFRAGTDDYMVKPINIEELLLRIGALLRRANIANEKKLIIGSLILDANAITAKVDGEKIPLTVREFNILFKMLSYPKHTFARMQLMDEFWGLDSNTNLRAVDTNITRLREKFSTCTDFEIVTVRGRGYRAITS